MPFKDFSAFFSKATGNQPYPYQRRLANKPVQSRLIHVPTGCGKTAAVIMAWVWQRHFQLDVAARASAPRRLVYCLPMRVLVEQTFEETVWWLDKLGVLAGTAIWEDQTRKKGLRNYEGI